MTHFKKLSFVERFSLCRAVSLSLPFQRKFEPALVLDLISIVVSLEGSFSVSNGIVP
jgi:hypothetical protein